MSALRFSAAALAATLLLAPRSAAAQMGSEPATPKLFVEARAGAAVPTFDIANTAKTGVVYGGTIGYAPAPRWVVMGEFDYGQHDAKASSAIEINTLHYMGKVGYSLTGPRERGWEALVNLGAGAVGFDVAGTTTTYFAINAGAKLTYNVNRNVGIVLSPQGDIAFTKKDELDTTNAWVWPISAGLRLRM